MRWSTQNEWKWHDWYAWHPVYIGNDEWVWLVDVQRRMNIHLYLGAKRFWEYRLKGDAE